MAVAQLDHVELFLINEPVLEEQINDPVSSIFMVKEDKETPMHQPYPILEYVFFSLVDGQSCKFMLKTPFAPI